MEVATSAAPTALETFRMETRAWLEANCPESQRQSVKSYTDMYWGW